MIIAVFLERHLIMKKLLCVIFSILMVACTAGCNEASERLSGEGFLGEFVILELTEKKLDDDIEFSIVDENGKDWLENADVDTVFVSYEKNKDRYLELRLTDDGIKKFKKAQRANKEGVLSIAIDGEKIASPVIKDDIDDNSVIVKGEYKEIMNYFNALT